jgi:hypothetical protein
MFTGAQFLEVERAHWNSGLEYLAWEADNSECGTRMERFFKHQASKRRE